MVYRWVQTQYIPPLNSVCLRDPAKLTIYLGVWPWSGNTVQGVNIFGNILNNVECKFFFFNIQAYVQKHYTCSQEVKRISLANNFYVEDEISQEQLAMEQITEETLRTEPGL